MNIEKHFYNPTSDEYAKELINKTYNYTINPMTPTILWTKMFDKYAIELSVGKRLSASKEPIYGVTVVDDKGRTELSTAVFSKDEAREHIKEIVNEIN